MQSPCPECATPIYVSLYGDYLYHADGRWLQTVHSGIRMLAWGLVGSAAFVMAVILMASAVGSNQDQKLLAIGVSVLVLLVAGLGFLGWWRATSPDATRFRRDKLGICVRLLTAATLADALALFGTLWFGWQWSYSARGPISVGWAPIWITGLTVFAIWPLRIVIGLYHLRRLCRRIPDADLARTCRRLAVAILLAWGGSAAVVALVAIPPRNSETLMIVWAIALGFGALLWLSLIHI